MTRAQLHTKFVAFRKKWLGRGVDFDGAYGSQCVDLCRQYLMEVHGWSRAKVWKAIPPGNAETWFENASTTYFSKILKGATNWPREGDIVVMYRGPFGHVFIAKGTKNNGAMYSLDQNWSVLRKTTDEAHTKTDIKGWLRVKGITA